MAIRREERRLVEWEMSMRSYNAHSLLEIGRAPSKPLCCPSARIPASSQPDERLVAAQKRVLWSLCHAGGWRPAVAPGRGLDRSARVSD